MKLAGTRARCCGARRDRRGLTLIELLVVMGLLALILGAGVGALASLDIGTMGSGSLVRSTLRSASNWSRSRQAPARVRIDAANGVLSAEGLNVVGTWHFESRPPTGAFGLDGELHEALLVEDGFVGKALSFAGAPAGALFEAAVHTDPAFDLRTGFQVQVVLRPEDAGGGRVIQVGEALRIDATRRFGLRVQLATQRFDEELGRLVPAGTATLETPQGILQPGHWQRVLVTYDRVLIAVHVEGLEVAHLEEEGDVVPVKSRLVLGGGERPWPGSIDALVISAVGASEEVVLPQGVGFVDGTPEDVFFAADGGLDRSRHEGPVLIPLEYVDGRTDLVRVNMYGTVE